MATISFDEKVVVTDPEMVEKMKRDIEGGSMMTDEQDEQIEFLNRIMVSWEFTKKDMPIVCIFYRDIADQVHMLSSRHDETGVVNIGEVYRTYLHEMKRLNKEEEKQICKEVDE